ncbi:MAG: DUF4276 family protein [Gemmataceae bacterium]|nr:DUF4276 family protein [Gemmataceae bacterium]
MSELYVFCEGRTEQNFCKQVLVPALRNLRAVHPIRIAFGRSKGIVHRGGLRSYLPVKKDIANMLAARPHADVFFTTMFDLYKLPKNFPGNQHRKKAADPRENIEHLERALELDVNDARFVPYLQLHEYETLLFSDLEAFQVAFDDCENAITNLNQEKAEFESIEEINDTPHGAPSKRIIRAIPSYRKSKATAGADVAEFIGLDVMRASSPHFDQWVKTLQSL